MYELIEVGFGRGVRCGKGSAEEEIIIKDFHKEKYDIKFADDNDPLKGVEIFNKLTKCNYWIPRENVRYTKIEKRTTTSKVSNSKGAAQKADA